MRIAWIVAPGLPERQKVGAMAPRVPDDRDPAQQAAHVDEELDRDVGHRPRSAGGDVAGLSALLPAFPHPLI